MAMNKKERAEFDRITDRLRLIAALRWTDAVAPDVPIPEGVGKLSIGYLPEGILSDDPRVSEACSSAVSHGYNHKRTHSQNGRALYSTRPLALRALRHEVEKRCAASLAKIDRQIENEWATSGEKK